MFVHAWVCIFKALHVPLNLLECDYYYQSHLKLVNQIITV